MGPVILCDKSTIQTLHRDCIPILHRYFGVLVPPILVAEVLGDLSKVESRSAPEKNVQSLASRLANINVFVNLDCRDLINSEIAGHRIEMKHRPILDNAKDICSSSGDKGLSIEREIHELAILRWRQGNFEVDEHRDSEGWRRFKTQMSWRDSIQKIMHLFGNKIPIKHSLEDVLEMVDDMLASWPDKLLNWFLIELGLTLSQEDAPSFLLNRLPYTHYCVRAALLAYLAMYYKLIPTRDNHNGLDVEYLFYIPFSNAFVSKDNLPRKLAKLLLNTQQMLIEHNGFEKSLNETACWLSALDESVRTIELKKRCPPNLAGSVCVEIWDRFMNVGYRDAPKLELTRKQEVGLMNHIKKLLDSEDIGKEHPGSSDNLDFIFRKRVMLASDPCPCRSGKSYRDCCQAMGS